MRRLLALLLLLVVPVWAQAEQGWAPTETGEWRHPLGLSLKLPAALKAHSDDTGALLVESEGLLVSVIGCADAAFAEELAGQLVRSSEQKMPLKFGAAEPTHWTDGRQGQGRIAHNGYVGAMVVTVSRDRHHAVFYAVTSNRTALEAASDLLESLKFPES